jgi:integrase
MVPLRQSVTLARKRPDRTWAVYFPSGGGASSSEKVARRFFRLKAEAEAFCAVKRAEVASLGALANGLDDDVKREALLCVEKLKPFGVSLVVAVDWFLKAQPTSGLKVTIADALKVLQHRITADGYSKRHSRNVGQIVSSFGRGRMDDPVSTITPHQAQGWLDDYRTRQGKPLSVVAFNTYRRYLSVFCNYCVKSGWMASNPLVGVRPRKLVAAVPRLLSPADLRVILGACPDELKPVIAIQALCGLRVAESARLKWSDVMLSDGGNFIRISAEAAKTSRRRLTPMPEGLAEYLKGARKDDGFVYAAGKGSVDSLQKATVTFRRSLVGVAWHRNALRASALSYRLALTKDAAATAFEFGNSSAILLRDYKELCTPLAAKEWFKVPLDYSVNL